MAAQNWPSVDSRK